MAGWLSGGTARAGSRRARFDAYGLGRSPSHLQLVDAMDVMHSLHSNIATPSMDRMAPAWERERPDHHVSVIVNVWLACAPLYAVTW